MASVKFFSSPDVFNDRQWVDSNQALDRVLDKADNHLHQARGMALSIWRSLQSLNPIMDELCRLSCPWCPNPCCIVNRTWYDFQDLLYLHLSKQSLPPGQIVPRSQEPCRYLGHRGCRIPRASRPWSCIVYICAVQQRRLVKFTRAKADYFVHTLESIRDTRHDLEAAVTKAVKTSPPHQ